jgi:hypothetical protein
MTHLPGPIVIIAIGFRSAVNTGPVSFTIPSSKVTLSTTQAYPNTKSGHTLPSATYANNIGPHATVVYNSAVSGSSPGCSGPAPCFFDMVLQLTTPFSFDPANGRLLIDTVSSGASAGATGSFGYQFFTDSTLSTVATVSGAPTQPTGTFNLGGLVIELQTANATYYFPQLAFGGGRQSTLTYVNYSPQNVSCTTSFYGDTGATLQVPFGGTPVSTRTDALAPGATLHQETQPLRRQPTWKAGQ